MQIHYLNTGYCTVQEHHVLRGGRRVAMRAHALVALIEHPSGWILFDTGYAPRVLEAFKVWPFGIYGLLTPTVAPPEQSVVNQLARFGLKPADITTIIVSHLHADHMGGLLDFPDTKLVISKAALDSVRGRKGLSALRKAYLPMLMPEYLDGRLQVIEHFSHSSLPHLGSTHDLLGDGSMRLVTLPGHAKGQMGMLLEDKTLLAADGCWHSRSYRENIPPHSLPLLLAFDNKNETLTTLQNLHEFHKARPDVKIIPTHCPEIAAEYWGEA